MSVLCGRKNVQIVAVDHSEQKLAVEWTIKNFSAITRKAIFCNPFSAEFCEQFNWRLCVFPDEGRIPGREAGRVGIYLGAPVGEFNEVTVHYAIALQDSKRNIIVYCDEKIKNFADCVHGGGSGDSNTSREDLISKLADDTLVVMVGIQFDTFAPLSLPGKRLRTLQNSRDTIDSETSDFTINIVATGKTICVHKAVLENLWPHFKTIANGQADEPSDKWDVVDFDYDTMKLVMRFIYSGSASLSTVTTAIKVMKAAHQFQMSELQKIARDFIYRRLDVGCVLEVLVTADSLPLSCLKKCCFSVLLNARARKRKRSGTLNLAHLPGYEHLKTLASVELLLELTNRLFSEE